MVRSTAARDVLSKPGALVLKPGRKALGSLPDNHQDSNIDEDKELGRNSKP